MGRSLEKAMADGSGNATNFRDHPADRGTVGIVQASAETDDSASGRGGIATPGGDM